MVLGRKRGADIDFTLLQKKGLIKKSPVTKRTGWKVDKSGFIEMPNPGAFINSDSGKEDSAGTNATPSNIGFLENMVGKQEFGSVDPNPLGGFFDNPLGFSPPESPSPPSLGNNLSVSNSEVESLKVKLDDLEYKLERLLERLDKLGIKGN